MLTTNALRTAEDFRQVVVDYAAEAAEHGAVYIEGIFSPSERVRRGVGWDEIFSGYCDGAQEARELLRRRGAPDTRHRRAASRSTKPRRSSAYAAQYRDRGVVGVGLGGLEARVPARAVRAGVRARARRGPRLGPPRGRGRRAGSVRGALEALGADRLRHGIRAVEDPGSCASSRARRSSCDVCPISNLRTRRRLLARGASAAAARRRRRALLDLDRRPRDVRHRPHPGLRRSDARSGSTPGLLRGGARRRPLRRRDEVPGARDRRTFHWDALGVREGQVP